MHEIQTHSQMEEGEHFWLLHLIHCFTSFGQAIFKLVEFRALFPQIDMNKP